MNRSQLLLLIVSWVTVASAGYVAGQAAAVAQRPSVTKGIQAGCASAFFPGTTLALEVSTSNRPSRFSRISE